MLNPKLLLSLSEVSFQFLNLGILVEIFPLCCIFIFVVSRTHAATSVWNILSNYYKNKANTNSIGFILNNFIILTYSFRKN